MVLSERASSPADAIHHSQQHDHFLRDPSEWRQEEEEESREQYHSEQLQQREELARAEQPSYLIGIDTLSTSSQGSGGQGRIGGVWIGQRSVTPSGSPSRTLGSNTMNPGNNAYNSSAAEESFRSTYSVWRSRVAGVLCLIAVLLMILSVALPKWLVRDELSITNASEDRLSSAVSVGLFSVCEDTITHKCQRYVSHALARAFRELLWDVALDDCREFYRATCICAIMACVLGAIATFFNFAVPKYSMVRYHLAVFISTILAVILAATALICWFVWSGKDLRRPSTHSERGAYLNGGRFELGVSFYFMFVSVVLMTLSGKLVLYEMFVTARRDNEYAAESEENSMAVADNDDLMSTALGAAGTVPAIFINHLADDDDNDDGLGPPSSDIEVRMSPPPAYREVEGEMLTSTSLLCAQLSSNTDQSSEMPGHPIESHRLSRALSGDLESCASSLWLPSCSESNTPSHLRAPKPKCGGTLPRNFKQSQADSLSNRSKTRRFKNRRRWSTVLGQRSQSSSDIDAISMASTSRHLDEDVTTYSVVPKLKRHHSQYSAHSDGKYTFTGDLGEKIATSSPDLNLGTLDFDLSLTMRSAALNANDHLELPASIHETRSASCELDDSDEATPVGLYAVSAFGGGGSTVAIGANTLHEAIFEYETDL